MRNQTITWYNPSEKLPTTPCSVLVRRDYTIKIFVEAIYFHPKAKIEYGMFEEHGGKLHPVFFAFDSELGFYEIPMKRIIEWAEVEG